MWSPSGAATDPGVSADQEITWRDALERDLHAEIVISGKLVNRSSVDALLTIRSTRSSKVRYPLRNQGLFLLNGEDKHRAVLKDGDTLSFTWVDRRPFEEWRRLHVATKPNNPFGDDDLKHPRLPFWTQARNVLKRFGDPIEDAYSDWASEVISESGFKVVAETRVRERVSAVWDVELSQAPMEPHSQDVDSQQTLWKLNGGPDFPIDDDVVTYRCHQDATLAQVDPPARRHVPGRL